MKSLTETEAKHFRKCENETINCEVEDKNRR